MRIVRFIGGLLTGLIALVLAVALFVYWFDFASSMAAAAGIGALGYVFLWMAFGLNLLLWTVAGLLRLAEGGVRKALRRRPEDLQRTAVTGGRHRERVLVGAGGPGGGVALAESGPEAGAANGAVSTVEPGGDLTEQRLAETTIAVIIPAHNEEPVIDTAISSALGLFNRWDIYVVSDSSKDATAEIAAKTGVNVLELLTNRGKAGAIEAVIEEFSLTENYDGVLILDADTELDAGYVEGAKRQLLDQDVAAVAGFVVSEWKPRERNIIGRIISAYRDRLYFMLQYFMRFGQTWKRANTSFIVPGFASVYRSRALREITVNPPGLVIEDFNMTFEVHRKRLGRISMRPDTKAYSQDPFTFKDYRKQVGRWTLGFWQTVRRHKVWPSFFWVALALYIIEVVLVSFLFLVTVAIAVFVLIGTFGGEAVAGLPYFSDGFTAVTAFLPLTALMIGLLVPDYMLTCVMTMIRRRPSYLFYGLFFFPIRVVDSYLSLRMIPKAWTAKSDGRWSPPTRVNNKDKK
ncbi:MAG: glycosyltransferase family 2 protein [Nocardiopsis sp. BM-2018]|uniref:Cellulose synthase/poly-beta-1,6-N-acetylglucosamine synthase-like glycosyltransferase n=1 Tax=Nocardiopsis metallicus TaxID=179819 RepID=A0A840WMB9_9ACTN|nr:glycosyltransferase [Nocardiopsis metallicus]MBB5494141.1 cellulose synthase/poly-beta-1,6-N-acetylglucosamine synthase-like glycosyltransferase [Nocardiopsis metallicus]QRN81087.1 MAG: glycosyltransferase family 2 protein [Nocardiopsis sp. BM-2018]